MTRLRRSACSPRLLAIAGIDTAIIVESSPSMKKAQPTTSGMATRSLGSLIRGMIMKSHGRDDRGREYRRGYRSGADRALGERPSRALSELGGQSAPRAAAPGAAPRRRRGGGRAGDRRADRPLSRAGP